MACRQVDGEAHSDGHLNLFRQKLQPLITLHDHHRTWLSNIRSLSFRMETYGIYAAENKKAALTEMILALDSLVLPGESLLSRLREDAGVYEQKMKNGTYLYMPFRGQHLAEMETTFQRVNDEWNRMVSCRGKLLSDGKHARTLFVVRER